MKNQQKTKRQTPQNGTETTKTKPQNQQEQQKRQAPQNGTETTTKNKSKEQEQKQTPQNGTEKTKNRSQDQQRENPLKTGKEHKIGDIEEPGTTKDYEGDVKKIKDPDPTIPEKRNDPVAGKGDDYSRTRNTPGKAETNSVGEFTEIDEMDREDESDETSDISDEERDEEEPGSFDPEVDQKEAFSGDKKNSPDERKNKNGL